MSSLSLDASIRTSKVSSSQAARIESDRFLNPNNMVCVYWDGYNNKGQQVHPDSSYTKTPGCNSAFDRVSVENDLRPQYGEYLNFNLAGVKGNIYGNRTSWDEAGAANAFEAERNKITGNFGNQWKSTNQTDRTNNYEKAMTQPVEVNRGASAWQGI